jgi:hypothetical protein
MSQKGQKGNGDKTQLLSQLREKLSFVVGKQKGVCLEGFSGRAEGRQKQEMRVVPLLPGEGSPCGEKRAFAKTGFACVVTVDGLPD